MLMEHAMDGGSRSAMFPGQLAKAHTALPVPTDGRVIKFQRGTSDVPAFKTGAPHAGADSLDDQVAFELGDGSDDHNDGAAQRLLTEADEQRQASHRLAIDSQAIG